MSNVIAAFSVEQVKQLTGLSVNQLRDWDNDGFFTPSLAYEKRSSPFSRIYTFDDVVGLRTLSILRHQYKVSRQHLRRAADKLKAYSGKPWSGLTLYALNGEVHFRNPDTGTIEGAVSRQIAAPIKLSSIAEDMKAKTDALKERKSDTVGKIERHRHVMRGEAVIAGTRIPVASIKSFANAGYSVDQILVQYPSLSASDVQAAIEHEDSLTRAA